MKECSLNKQDPTAKFLMETRYHVRRVKALRRLSHKKGTKSNINYMHTY